MADEKRKVIKPKKPESSGSALPSFKQQMDKSVKDNLSGLADTEIEFDRVEDQYPSISTKKDETGKPRTVVAPARTAGVDADQEQKSIGSFIQVDDNRPPDHQTKRAQDIAKIINAYDKASKERAFRSRQTGTGAASIALSNPAAAREYARGRQKYEDQPTDSILGGQKAGQMAAKTEDDVVNLADKDDQRDSSSNVSTLYRQQLKKNGIQVPDNVSAFDIKRVFPFIQLDTKRDTAIRGQDVTAETADENRASRQKQGAANRGVKVSQGDKNRTVKISEGQANRKAGVGKVILGGALAQQKADASGTSGAQQKTADAATIPDSFNPSGFYVKKPGMPPSQKDAAEMKQLGAQAAKYDLAMEKLYKVMTAPVSSRPTIFNENWPEIKTLFANAVQKNIKAMGNGVANGGDVEWAINQIGSPSDIQNFIRDGIPQKIIASRQQIRDEYNRVADARGFTKSTKPSDISITQGTGGSSSSKKPVNPATAASANQVAGDYGFGPVVGQSNQPQQAGQMVNFALPNGQIKKISRKSAQVLERAGRGRIQ